MIPPKARQAVRRKRMIFKLGVDFGLKHSDTKNNNTQGTFRSSSYENVTQGCQTRGMYGLKKNSHPPSNPPDSP